METATELLRQYWSERLDWDRVGRTLDGLPTVRKYVCLESLQNPKPAPTYGVHPLARELACPSLAPQVQRLDCQLQRVTETPDGAKRASELSTLDCNPSERYWSWLSEVETACLLANRGFDVDFTDDCNKPDLLVKLKSGRSIYVEATASLKQEVGFFELRQLLGCELGDRFWFRIERARYCKSPKMPPCRVWSVFNDVRSCLQPDRTGSTWSKPYEDSEGVPFSVVSQCRGGRASAGFNDFPPEGKYQDTLDVRTREICDGKKCQISRAQWPTVLVVCLVQDEVFARAMEKAKGWKPRAEDMGCVKALMFYDTGFADCPPYGPWRNGDPGSEPLLNEFCQAWEAGKGNVG